MFFPAFVAIIFTFCCTCFCFQNAVKARPLFVLRQQLSFIWFHSVLRTCWSCIHALPLLVREMKHEIYKQTSGMLVFINTFQYYKYFKGRTDDCSCSRGCFFPIDNVDYVLHYISLEPRENGLRKLQRLSSKPLKSYRDEMRCFFLMGPSVLYLY